MKYWTLPLALVACIPLIENSSMAAGWDNVNNPELLRTDWNPMPLERKFSNLKPSAILEDDHLPWADSYWPKNRGAMTYRWKEFQSSGAPEPLTSKDREKFFSYKLFTREELKRLSVREIENLSPLEKYSIFIGDYQYRLVEKYRDKNKPWDAFWEGYCHAWSAVALHYSEPRPVTVVNRDGIVISFGSSDIKALLVANYSDRFDFSFGNIMGSILGKTKRAERRQVGNRCQKRFMYPVTKVRQGVEMMADYGDTEGREDFELENLVREYSQNVNRLNKTPINPALPKLAREGAEDPACQDTNAGAFHLVMTNMIGGLKRGFVIDKTRDVEVWNQPVFQYESEVVNGSAPIPANAAPGTVRAVEVKTRLHYADDTDYGYAFFNPTLTSFYKPDSNFMEEFLRYQNRLIQEGDEDSVMAYPNHILDYSSYHYVLELNAVGEIIGGTWKSLDRPDFLWVMKQEGFVGPYAQLSKIYQPIHIDH